MKRLAVFSLCLLLLFSFMLSFTSSAVDESQIEQDSYFSQLQPNNGLELDDNFISTSPQPDENGYYYDKEGGFWYIPKSLDDFSNAPFQSSFNSVKNFSLMATSNSSGYHWSTDWHGEKWVYTNYFSLSKFKDVIKEKYKAQLGSYPSETLIDDNIVVNAFTVDRGSELRTYVFATYISEVSHYNNINIIKKSTGFQFRMTSKFPIVHFCVNANTGDFITFRSTKGLGLAPYLSSTSMSNAKTFTGLSNTSSSSISVNKVWYLDFPISFGTNFDLVSNKGTEVWGFYADGTTQPVENITASQLWGVSSYPDPNTYSQVLEEQRHEETKGLLSKLFTNLTKSITNLFKSLVEDIKGLFIPAEGYFEALTNDMKEFFQNRFGFLYEFPTYILGVLNAILHFEPLEDGHYIHFPEIQTPSIENGIMSWYTIMEERDIQFEFLNTSPFSTLYDGYRAFTYFAFAFFLINLFLRKFNEIFTK